ncbi:uncharacterized protein LOC123018889 isoform X2 [Varanus komodoensis]|uniref:uncharacterized protein LOC123018889 isoform X2 n=1 Tax=Varanus komodoensis TaxID=61221 RepID=UPI001CF7B695|nr:uncharacterized protein LOC123018889 isoform X2 [Varanus komodoensis]
MEGRPGCQAVLGWDEQEGWLGWEAELPASGRLTSRWRKAQVTCQSFQCSGARCYQEEVHRNSVEFCHNASYCKLSQLNSTSYTAGCSNDCGNSSATEMCTARHGQALDTGPCTVECCSAPDCLGLNASAYGDLPLATTPLPSTTPSTPRSTTTRTPPKNGKVCSSFTCHGEGCYQGRKPSISCIVGYDFCEMKKTGPHFVAGCSKVCKTAGPACAARSTAPCYQECCPAVPKTSCLKLDGKVHFNRATHVPLAPPASQVLAWAAVIGLTCYALSSTGLN